MTSINTPDFFKTSLSLFSERIQWEQEVRGVDELRYRTGKMIKSAAKLVIQDLAPVKQHATLLFVNRAFRTQRIRRSFSKTTEPVPLVERWTPGGESPGSRRFGARYMKLLTGMARLVGAAAAS